MLVQATGVKPLDLSMQPPRSAHLAAGGIIFLPRSIDKARAYLPGGNPGAYRLEGYTEMMLQTLGLERAWFETLVATNADEHVAVDAIAAATDETKIRAWNDRIGRRTIREADRADIEARYPVAKELPDGALMLDVLDADDAAAFAPPA